MINGNGKRHLRLALFAAPVAVMLQPIQGDAQERLFGSTGGIGGMRYYELAVRKMQKDGEVFFGVEGYGEQPEQRAKVKFRALFNCGNRSKVGVLIENVMRNDYPIQDRVKNVATSRGMWYSLQDYHCHTNHYNRNPDEVWKQ